MKAYYIFDSYCGWCYGFETILKPFIEAHPELEVTVLSGGLFMDGHSLSAFPYMSDTNKRIADMVWSRIRQAISEPVRDGKYGS